MKSVVEKMKNISNHLVSSDFFEKSSQVYNFGCMSSVEPCLVGAWCSPFIMWYLCGVPLTSRLWGLGLLLIAYGFTGETCSGSSQLSSLIFGLVSHIYSIYSILTVHSMVLTLFAYILDSILCILSDSVDIFLWSLMLAVSGMSYLLAKCLYESKTRIPQDTFLFLEAALRPGRRACLLLWCLHSVSVKCWMCQWQWWEALKNCPSLLGFSWLLQSPPELIWLCPLVF